MFNSRSDKILSILNQNCPVDNGRVQKKQKKKTLKKKDIPEYVALFDKGEWEALDSILNPPNLLDKANEEVLNQTLRNEGEKKKVENNGEEVCLQDEIIRQYIVEGKKDNKNKELLNLAEDKSNKGNQSKEKTDEEEETADKVKEVRNNDKNKEFEASNQVEVGSQFLVEEGKKDNKNKELLNLAEDKGNKGNQSKEKTDEEEETADKVKEVRNNDKNKEFEESNQVEVGSHFLVEEGMMSANNLTDVIEWDEFFRIYQGKPLEDIGEVSVTNLSEGQQLKENGEETEVEGDCEEIIINEVSKHENGKRLRNKQHCCKFCQKMCIAISRHLLSVHKNELAISEIEAITNKKDRKKALEKLVREGDYYYKKEVLLTGNGELILIRRPTPLELKTHTYKDYGPCSNCLGFMLKEHIWHHVKYSCKEVIEPSTSKKSKLGSEALLAAGLRETFSEEYENFVIGKLSNDEVGLEIKKDSVLLQYGEFLFQKNQLISPQQRGQNVRSAIRALASICLKIQSKSRIESVCDLLDPVKFDMIVETVKEVCQFKNISKECDLKSPSVAIRLGIELVKFGDFFSGLCIKQENTVKEKKVKKFIHLIKTEWNTRVSSTARSTLDQRKYNTTELLPLTSDLMKLTAHLETVCEEAKGQLIQSTNPKAYRQLSEALLSRIILFNKRRSGETSKLKLSHYLNRGDWQMETNEELKRSMSTTEKELANKLTLIYTKGKRSSKVAVLLTDKMKSYLELLIDKRHLYGIHEDNQYIFARPSPAETPLRGHDCLKRMCSDAGLTCYERITGTKLRKYIATVTQILNLSENETDWLAKHLGHDLHVHRNFYRLHESAIELTKVSRLLLTVDQGKANKFAGKTLNEISIDDISDLEEDEEISVENENMDCDVVEDDDCTPKSLDVYQQPTIQYHEEESSDKGDIDYNIEEESDEEEFYPRPKKQCQKTRVCKKTPWSPKEKAAVLSFFARHIRERKGGIKKIAAEQCIAAHEVLKARSWLNIRDFVRNYMRKL